MAVPESTADDTVATQPTSASQVLGATDPEDAKKGAQKKSKTKKASKVAKEPKVAKKIKKATQAPKAAKAAGTSVRTKKQTKPAPKKPRAPKEAPAEGAGAEAKTACNPLTPELVTEELNALAASAYAKWTKKVFPGSEGRRRTGTHGRPKERTANYVSQRIRKDISAGLRQGSCTSVNRVGTMAKWMLQEMITEGVIPGKGADKPTKYRLGEEAKRCMARLVEVDMRDYISHMNASRYGDCRSKYSRRDLICAER